MLRVLHHIGSELLRDRWSPKNVGVPYIYNNPRGYFVSAAATPRIPGQNKAHWGTASEPTKPNFLTKRPKTTKLT